MTPIRDTTKGKVTRVLTIAGSGDFAQVFFASGAYKVDLFDCSAYSLYWSELKLLAARKLTLERYLQFFHAGGVMKRRSRDNWDQASGRFQKAPLFEKTIYLELRSELSPEAQLFFDLLTSDEFSQLFHFEDKSQTDYGFARLRDRSAIGDVIQDEKGFNELQAALRSGSWSCIEKDVEHVTQERGFDLTYISNIGYTPGKTVSQAVTLHEAGHPRVMFTLCTTPEGERLQNGTSRFFLDSSGTIRDRTKKADQAFEAEFPEDKAEMIKVSKADVGSKIPVPLPDGSIQEIEILGIATNVHYGVLAELRA